MHFHTSPSTLLLPQSIKKCGYISLGKGNELNSTETKVDILTTTPLQWLGSITIQASVQLYLEVIANEGGNGGNGSSVSVVQCKF